MERVPIRLLALVSARAGVMVPEPIDHLIPDWPVVTDHQTFGERDEEIVRDEVPDAEVRLVEIHRLLGGPPMLVDPRPQFVPYLGRVGKPLARSSRHCLAYIDGLLRARDRLVQLVLAGVIERIDSRTEEFGDGV